MGEPAACPLPSRTAYRMTRTGGLCRECNEPKALVGLQHLHRRAGNHAIEVAQATDQRADLLLLLGDDLLLRAGDPGLRLELRG